MLTYNGLKARLAERGVKYRLRREGISASVLARVLNGTGGIEAVTLNKLCRSLDCQPGDLIEYVDDQEQNSQQLTAEKE